MSRKSAPSGASGFTLLELLIVIAIIAVLSTMVISVAAGVKTRAAKTLAFNQIKSLDAAITMYSTETGKFPRRPGPASAATAYRNDIAYLYAALRNRPTAALGGGPQRSVDWPTNQIALAPIGVEGADFGSQNMAPELPSPRWLDPISALEADLSNTPAYQAAHLPGSNAALVFTDPWGNPLVYREWATVPESVKYGPGRNTASTLVLGGRPEPHVDRCHEPYGYEIWSFGPNGVNEFGEGDDIVSWRAKP